MQFILEMIGAYPKQSCTNIIDFFEKNIDTAKPGGAGIHELDNLEITLGINFTNPNPNSFGLENTLRNAIREYKNKFPHIDESMEEWTVDGSCQLMKYEPNQHYHYIHCESSKMWRDRIFAWMIYLNDIKDGGGTHFVHQNFTTKPNTGNFYIWPAGWTHMHHGVNAPNETKYIITGWVSYI